MTIGGSRKGEEPGRRKSASEARKYRFERSWLDVAIECSEKSDKNSLAKLVRNECKLSRFPSLSPSLNSEQFSSWGFEKEKE